MPCLGRYLTFISGATLIGCALSIDLDLNDSLFVDDSNIFTTDVESGENLDFPFLESDGSFNSPAGLGFGDDIFSALEASCAQIDGTQTIGKARHRRDFCLQDTEKPITANDRDPGLKLPNLLETPQQTEEPQGLIPLDSDNNDECPPPYSRRVCCEGPGVQSFPASGIYDLVQNCSPCRFLIDQLL